MAATYESLVDLGGQTADVVGADVVAVAADVVVAVVASPNTPNVVGCCSTIDVDLAGLHGDIDRGFGDYPVDGDRPSSGSRCFSSTP